MTTMQVQRAQQAAQLLTSRQDFIRRLVEETRASIEVLDNDPATRSLLEASISENVTAAINFLAEGVPVSFLEAPSAAIAYARSVAQRNIPLTALTRAYRLGYNRFMDFAMESIADQGPEERIVLIEALFRRSAEYLDEVSEQVGAAYERERERAIARQTSVRHQWMREVLTDGRVDQAQAERALDYPLGAVHVAGVLWGTETGGTLDGSSTAASAEATIQRLAHYWSATATVMIPVDESEFRVWFAVPTSARLAVPEYTPEFMHGSFGMPRFGVAGFRSSARQADQVRDLVTASPLPGSSTGWTHYAEVAPLALMAGDMAGLREFVVATLGPLSADDERSALLRDTLRVYLEHQQSAAATAEAMTLHRNSVRYRIQQAEQLLPDTGIASDLNLRAALAATHWLGSSVLDR